MTIQHAIKALGKHGWEVRKGANGVGHKYIALKAGNRHEISFLPNGQDRPDQDVVCLKVRGLTDHDDIQSDYSAGSFVDTIPQALRCASDSGSVSPMILGAFWIVPAVWLLMHFAVLQVVASFGR